MVKIVIATLFIVLLAGCTRYQISTTMSRYDDASERVDLGDTKEEVLEIMVPTQEKLSRSQTKTSDKYYKGDTLVEIYYFRSGWQPDGLTTDDEFTPYVFNDGRLVAVGWQMLGGAQSKGQVVPRTNVNVQHNTVVY